MKYLKNVVTLKYDESLCISCGMCVNVCPHEVFVLEGKARIIDRDRCMECGACAKNCSVGAISVKEGVGCAAAIILGSLKGGEPDCGCC